MTQINAIKSAILSTIRKGDYKFPFRDLECSTGLAFEELSSVIGLLIKEETILMRINHSSDCHYKFNGNYLYERFKDLLFTQQGRKQSVTFYASNLCITPKYLCAVVKQASGKTPSEWINEETVKHIENMLCYTQMSIKEIACELEFPNLSFFGKFFKAQKGMSPKHYREAYIKNSQSLSA